MEPTAPAPKRPTWPVRLAACAGVAGGWATMAPLVIVVVLMSGWGCEPDCSGFAWMTVAGATWLLGGAAAFVLAAMGKWQLMTWTIGASLGVALGLALMSAAVA